MTSLSLSLSLGLSLSLSLARAFPVSPWINGTGRLGVQFVFPFFYVCAASEVVVFSIRQRVFVGVFFSSPLFSVCTCDVVCNLDAT